jgi:hypothetical protein
MSECLKRLTLTPEQTADMAPMLKATSALSGAIFAQVRPGAFPENERVFLHCLFLPQESARRLRKWFDSETERLAKAADKKETLTAAK